MINGLVSSKAKISRFVYFEYLILILTSDKTETLNISRSVHDKSEQNMCKQQFFRQSSEHSTKVTN